MTNKILIVTSCCCAVFANEQIIEVYAPTLTPTDIYFSQENAIQTNTFELNERLDGDVSYYLSAPSSDFARSNISFRGVDSRATGYIEDLIPVFKNTQQSISPYNFYTTDNIVSNSGIRPSSIGVVSPGSDIEILRIKPKSDFEGEISQTFSNNDSLSQVSIGGKNDKIWYKTAFSYYDRDSYKLSDDFIPTTVQPTYERVNSDKLYKSAMAKVGYLISENNEIAFKVSASEADYGIAPTKSDADWNWYKRIKDQKINNFYLYFDNKLDKSELNLRAYYDTYKDILLEYTDSTYSSLKDGYALPPTQYDITRLGALAKYSLIEDKNKLSFVLNYEENQNTITREKYLNDNSVPSWKFQNILSSIILQNKVNSVDIESALTYKKYAPLKIDYDGYDFESSADATSEDLIDAQIMVSAPFENYVIFANLAQTSRIPSMFELSTFSSYEEANLGLKPEISKNVEIGIRKNLSTGYLSVSGYYYDIKDKILKKDDMYINEAKSINQGIEFKYNFERDNQSLNFGYSYIDAKDSSSKQINLIPHNKAKIDYKFQPSSAMALLASYSYFDKSNYDNETLPSYELVDISSSYKFQKNITLTASIKNLFDENYFYTYTDPAMGRSYYLTMNWKF